MRSLWSRRRDDNPEPDTRDLRDPPIRITQPAHLDRGDIATITRLDMGAHTGTHVDAPAHFVKGGPGADGIDLNALVGPALVVHVPGPDAISAGVLSRMMSGVTPYRLVAK